MDKIISIGIIEDDVDYLDSIKDIIDDLAEFECVFAVNSAEKAHSLIKESQVPDVILHDIELGPHMNGIESCHIIKNLSPKTHIIMLTNFNEDDKIFYSILHGADGYLLKQSPSEKIVEGVFNVVGGGAAMNPFIAAKVVKLLSGKVLPKNDYNITTRQKGILIALTDGLTKPQIGDKLGIKTHTVETHLKNIYKKLHVHSQIDLITKIYKERLI